MELLHALSPKAVRVAMLVNPANVPVAERTLREAQEAARAIGLQLRILNASTDAEIEAAFDVLARDRPDALLISADAFFVSRRGGRHQLESENTSFTWDRRRRCLTSQQTPRRSKSATHDR